MFEAVEARMSSFECVRQLSNDGVVHVRSSRTHCIAGALPSMLIHWYEHGLID